MGSDKSHYKEASSFDIRCSTSCTRAGVTALILASIAMSMLISFRNLKPFISLAEYVSIRFTLNDNLEMLEEDQCWKELLLKTVKESPERWPFTKLLDYECNDPQLKSVTVSKTKKDVKSTPPEDKNKEEKPSDDKNNSSAKKKYARLSPPPPMKLRISKGLTGVNEISTSIVKLFDDKFLHLARTYTHKFDRSIYKWQNYRTRVISKAGGYPIQGTMAGLWRIENGQFYWDKISKENPQSIFENLTLEKIKLLAKYELPTYEEFKQFLKKFSKIEIPTIGLPMSFYAGSIFIEFALCFVLLYFWLFQSESKISENYPSPSTLFGVFGRRRLNHILLLILIMFSPIAAALLAFLTLSLTWLNVIPAVIINIISIFIAYETRDLSKQSKR